MFASVTPSLSSKTGRRGNDLDEEAIHQRRPQMVVLLVDDNALILDVTGAMLEALGHHVISASSGTEALQRLEHDEQIEVLLTDINIPNMSGLELAERAKRLRQSLKVVFISGQDSPVADVPVLQKPFGETDLDRVLGAMNASS
jgi:CheY-like chemotaxis protein